MNYRILEPSVVKHTDDAIIGLRLLSEQWLNYRVFSSLLHESAAGCHNFALAKIRGPTSHGKVLAMKRLAKYCSGKSATPLTPPSPARKGFVAASASYHQRTGNHQRTKTTNGRETTDGLRKRHTSPIDTT
jgi:hypothetical protein